MADLESKAQWATIVGASCAVICLPVSVLSLVIAWKSMPASTSGGGQVTHVWLWVFLCSFGLLSIASVAMNVWAWRLQYKARREKTEAVRLKAELYESARSNLEYRGERDKCEEEKLNLQHWRNELFTPLQVEALTLSRDLGKFLADAEPYPTAPLHPSFDDAYDHYRGKGYDWGIRFRAKYDAQFSARMKDFVSHLEIEKERVNSILRGGFEGVHTTEMVEKLRGELWREAMYAAGADFDKGD